MAKLKLKSRGTFAREIEARLESRTRFDPPRDYIGASIIGNNCDRALFYVRERVQQEAVDAQSLRIFDFGDAIETLAMRWLRDAGLFVYDRDPRTGGQFRITTPDGTLGGHLDACVSTTRLSPDLYRLSNEIPRIALLEVKSHKDNRFLDVVDLGVQTSKFEHYAQMQTYMGNSEQIAHALGLRSHIDLCLYFAINKNTSEVYLEEVSFRPATYLALTSRAGAIHRARAPYPRLASAKDKSSCKWCSFATHCFDDERAVEFQERARDAGCSSMRTNASLPKTSRLRDSEW